MEPDRHRRRDGCVVGRHRQRRPERRLNHRTAATARDSPRARSRSLGGHGEHPREADARRHRGPLEPTSGRPTTPTASTARRPATQVFAIDTPAADGQRLAAHRPRVQLHPHRHDRPLPADARQAASSTRSAGTTTGCPPSAGCRTTSACAATRRSRTTPTSSRRSAATPPKDHRAVPISRPNFVELCDELVDDRRAGLRSTCSAGSGSRSTGRCCTRRSTSARRRASQRAFLRNLARGEAYQQDAPTLWDIDDQHRGRPGRDGGPRASPARTTSSRSTAPTATATS